MCVGVIWWLSIVLRVFVVFCCLNTNLSTYSIEHLIDWKFQYFLAHSAFRGTLIKKFFIHDLKKIRSRAVIYFLHLSPCAFRSLQKQMFFMIIEKVFHSCISVSLTHHTVFGFVLAMLKSWGHSSLFTYNKHLIIENQLHFYTRFQMNKGDPLLKWTEFNF